MNKKVYLILLAVAAQQSSVLAKTTTGEIGFDMYERHEARKKANEDAQANQSNKETPQIKTSTSTLHISQAISENPEYRAKLQEQLQKLLAGKQGSVDVTDIETTIITEYAPKILQPATDALNELKQQVEEIEQQGNTLWTPRKVMIATVAALVIGGAVGHYTK